MTAGTPGNPARFFSSTAVETALQSSIPAQSQGQSNTSFIVASVSGFPTTYPYTLIVDPDTSKEEVLTVTSGSSTTLTVTRGADGTQAVAHSAGAVVRHGVSGRDFRESQNHIAARGYDLDEAILTAANQTHVHGIGVGDGSIVGTTKAQTITNKVYSSGTFTGAFTASGATFTSPTISGSPVITGLSSVGMSTSSAVPKIYVDTIFQDAESAATSAASAAVSASSAATSATSALNSASAAATSASSASTSATSAATSANSAASSATAASTSATSAENSATAAATSATSAATSASSALTSANSAATSATSASSSATAAASSEIAAATSAASAASSATSANSSAIAAATSATSAATSATSAATSATSAENSATAAATSASSASLSADAAATSAASAAASTSAAATSAASAAVSATSAASSATSAEASYDSFDDRYLGAKSSPPTVDNDGDPLLTGALYWNTVVNQMFVWSGSAWGGISSTADIFRYKYTATGGETSFSGPDDNSLTLSYLVGKEQVYLNGVLLVRATDYVATDGTSIASLAAVAASDILEVITFTAFDLTTALDIDLFEAKGDLLSASAAATPARLALGTNGYYLSVDTSTTSGLAWAVVPEPDLDSVEIKSIMGVY